MSFDAFASGDGSHTQAPATPDSSTPAPDQSTPDTSGAAAAASGSQNTPAEGGDADPAAAGTPEWQPNFKFKVMDKEHEIPESFRAAIKDAETEKQAREIFEKAYGLDTVKERLKTTQEKYKAVEGQFQTFQTQVGELREIYTRGDFENFFKKLGIPEEKVLKWVVDKAQYSQLPPEQRQALDARRSAEERAYQLEKQVREVQQNYEAQATQAKAQGLQTALEKPEVKMVAQAYDAKNGQNAFFQEVAAYGDYVWQASQGKVDLTPDQAIQAVLKRVTAFGSPVQQQPSPASAQQPPVIPQAGGNPAAAKPVKPLPNLAGRNSTQVGKPRVKSIADLKKLAAESSG